MDTGRHRKRPHGTERTCMCGTVRQVSGSFHLDASSTHARPEWRHDHVSELPPRHGRIGYRKR